LRLARRFGAHEEEEGSLRADRLVRGEDGRVDDVRQREPRTRFLFEAVAVGEARAEDDHLAEGRDLPRASERLLRVRDGQRETDEEGGGGEEQHEFPF
jgi:hypothetical protein